MIRFLTTAAVILVAWLVGYCTGWLRGYDRAEYLERARGKRP